ncbi:transposase, partial [Ruminococcus sp. YE78]|uniref:transposase n=1 Tax=Ruminococcus sp. YE78 TaxID=1352374 RepID=UPI00088EAF3F
AGGSIEAEMAALGIADQTIKAQLIYVSFFDNVDDFNANSYANLFKTAPDDAALIDSINQNYGLEISYDYFMHTYTFVMNNTINPYMFSDPTTKNAADLAAWANNAYVSGWGYKAGFTGQKDTEKQLRYCDNAGMMIGYLNYISDSKTFGNAYDTLTFTEQGDLSTMPEGVFGVLKQDHGFRRFLCRGKNNIRTEFLLLGLAYNIKKFFAKISENRLGISLFELKTA